MNAESNKIIRFEEVNSMIGGVHRTTLLKWEKDNCFPKRIKTGKRLNGWFLKEIQEWIENKKRQ